MIGEIQRRIVATAVDRIVPRIQPAIVQLAEAYDYAYDVRADRWQYAVEIEALRRLGLTARDLKWLVNNKYAKHAREVTKPEDRLRKFRPSRTLVLTDRSCFVTTTAGMALTTIEVIRPMAAQRAAAGRRPKVAQRTAVARRAA